MQREAGWLPAATAYNNVRVQVRDRWNRVKADAELRRVGVQFQQPAMIRWRQGDRYVCA
jgi:hypothetical protein